MKENEYIRIILIIVVIILLVLVLTPTFAEFIKVNKKRYVTNAYNEKFDEFCETVGPPIYGETSLEVASDSTFYYKPSAKFLIDVSTAVSNANCTNILPINNPPSFSKQQILQGEDPNNKGNNIMYGYIFWNDTQAIISFSGTKLLTEWVSDFQFSQEHSTKLNNYVTGMMVHKGFYEIYLSIREQILTWFKTNNPSQVFVTGHSLGGALSTICALDILTIVENIGGTLTQYSFGSPRVGNIIFAGVFNQLIKSSFRVSNVDDGIVSIPPSKWLGYIYQHVGQYVPFNKNLGNSVRNHVITYKFFLPECPEVANCDSSN